MPRKSYREYQADIFPDTPGPNAAMGPLDWLQGGEVAPPRVSLNPVHRQSAPGGSLVKHGPPLADLPRQMLGKSAETMSANKFPTAASPKAGNDSLVMNGNGHESNNGPNLNGTAAGPVGTATAENTREEPEVMTGSGDKKETASSAQSRYGVGTYPF